MNNALGVCRSNSVGNLDADLKLQAEVQRLGRNEVF
jgi:hypothetical protein